MRFSSDVITISSSISNNRNACLLTENQTVYVYKLVPEPTRPTVQECRVPGSLPSVAVGGCYAAEVDPAVVAERLAW